MKNVLLTFSLALAFLAFGCSSDKADKTVETTTSETTTTESPAHGDPDHNHETDHQTAAIYSCPMHPEVTSESPGDCPKCGMALEKMALPNEPAQ